MTCCLMAVQNAGLWEIASTQKIRMVPAAHYPVRWAANLAQGLSLADAVAASKAYVTEAIEYSLPIGGGCGPTHHFVDLYRKAGWLK